MPTLRVRDIDLYYEALGEGAPLLLIQRLGFAPAHVLGLSMGGMIALQLAADAPHLVRSLTIANSGPSFHLTPDQRQQYAWRRPLIRLLGMRGVGLVLGRRLFPRPADAALRQRFAERWADNDRRAYLTALDGFAGWSVEEELPAIPCPALIVAAEHDYTPVAYKRAYAAKMPNARVAVIPDARHAAPVEQPEAFNERVASFLANGA